MPIGPVDTRCMPEGVSGGTSRSTGTIDDEALPRMLDHLPDAVVVIDSECTVKWANRSAERLFGRTRTEAVGVSGLELVHPDDLEMVLRSLVSVQGKEVGTSIEVRISTGSGWRLVELLGAPISWLADGAILLCLRDLTDRRRYELAHGEEALVQSLVQNSAAVTMLVSADGIVVSVSGAH